MDISTRRLLEYRLRREYLETIEAISDESELKGGFRECQFAGNHDYENNKGPEPANFRTNETTDRATNRFQQPADYREVLG